MCNIAGYVGTRAATPILLDMIRKQDFWDTMREEMYDNSLNHMISGHAE